MDVTGAERCVLEVETRQSPQTHVSPSHTLRTCFAATPPTDTAAPRAKPRAATTIEPAQAACAAPSSIPQTTTSPAAATSAPAGSGPATTTGPSWSTRESGVRGARR